jgi:glycosyltransferase involved in cell wall biosynthesis
VGALGAHLTGMAQGRAGTSVEPSARSRWSSSGPGELDLSLVVPFYNPGDALRDTVLGAAETLASTGISYEIIAVSDGSTDGSGSSLDGLLPGTLVTLDLTGNRGKGEALRVGLGMGRGRYLGFIDADGDLPAELLRGFVDAVRLDQPDIALGSKRHPASDVHYPPLRRLYSWGYQWLIRLLFDLNVRDTQTGIKLIRRDVLEAVMPRMVERGFAFDLELFVVAHHLGFDRFVELPVRIRERFSSTVSPRAVYLILSDTMAVFWRLRIRRFYDDIRRHAD